MSSSNDNSQPEQQNGHKKDRTQVRAEVMGLNQQRTALERELREFQEVLQSQGVGMDDPLVDNEGFPRNDIDIYTVRTARNRIICITNDLRNLMKQIEDKMADYFIES